MKIPTGIAYDLRYQWGLIELLRNNQFAPSNLLFYRCQILFRNMSNEYLPQIPTQDTHYTLMVSRRSQESQSVYETSPATAPTWLRGGRRRENSKLGQVANIKR